MNDWNLREEILAVTHRWVEIICFLFIGALIGWILSYIWPTSYRASVELYVGLNAYRAADDRYVESFAEVELRNLDDYKNWQMAQLNSLATTKFVRESLLILRSQDPYWENVELIEFLDMLNVYWRNPGTWSLVVNTAEYDHSFDIALVWSDVVLNQVEKAIFHANEVLFLDYQLRSLSDHITEINARKTELSVLREKLDIWRDNLLTIPIEEPISEQWNSKIWALAERNSGQNEMWDTLIGKFPEANALPNDFLDWIDYVDPLVEGEIDDLKWQLNELNVQRSILEEQYFGNALESRGLSANLYVERPLQINPEVVPVRPFGLTLLIGGGTGLLVWGLLHIIRVSRRKE